jgi:pyridoxine 5-phosphate synthase
VITPEVFSKENRSVEAQKMTVIHKKTGSQCVKHLRALNGPHESKLARPQANLCALHKRFAKAWTSQHNPRQMLKLGVNIDHVATLREARYRGCETGEPDPVAAALACEAAGAHGITAHLREDRRHIQDRDIWRLRESIRTRLNLEMANSPEIVAIALQLKPDITCLVPERRQEVTTEGGLDVAGNLGPLTETRKRLNEAGIDVSLFIAPDPRQIEAAARTGSQFIELHTGAFAEAFKQGPERQTELERLITAAEQARSLGLKVNAGHGLNYENLALVCRVPHLVELNIGHSIVSRAIQTGLPHAVKQMLELMSQNRG